jgi:exonuclease III
MVGRFILIAGALILLGLFAGTVRAHAAQTVSPQDQLQVWNLNTHRMAKPCNAENITDYHDFVDYITDANRVAYFPDIVTLQEAGTQIVECGPFPSCTFFRDALEARTGRNYWCRETGFSGGSAIVYRNDAASGLSFPGSAYRDDIKINVGAVPNCNIDNDSNPWTTLALRLKDNSWSTAKYVTVASVHLNPSGDCAWENMKLISPRVDALGTASMKIMAGDWNHFDALADNGVWQSWECWYNGTNVNLGNCGNTVGNLGWKDAMYRLCAPPGSSFTPQEIYQCLQANHQTHAGKRIDFLFAKTYAIYNQVTVPYDDADVSAGQPTSDTKNYSDHRGQGALLKYN